MKKSYPLKKIIFGIAVLSVGLFSSCKEGENAQPETNPAETSGQADGEAVQVNPAHGQPGHTCALPVGAPLNSTGNSQQNNEEQTAQVNPAHGLPGHTCALPVGAPLSSASTTQSTSNNIPSSTVSPIRVDQTPEINPPHGEPGHTCSVPVGTELE